MTRSRALRSLELISSITLIGLIFLCLGWELWFAPLRPGGSMLVLKTFPLLLPLFGILKGRRYTYQWASMMVLLYFAEGVVRATSDPGISRYPAMVEVAITLAFFASTVTYARMTRPSLATRPPGD